MELMDVFTITLKKNIKVELRLRYEVPKIAYASHLKSDIQTLFYGRFYLRELATPDNTIKFENMFEPLEQNLN